MEIFEQYAVVDSQLKELEAKKEALRTAILTEMVNRSVEKLETPMGKFSITRLKKWEYPEEVIEIGEKFKAEKARAESTGDATFTESESLRFTGLKL